MGKNSCFISNPFQTKVVNRKKMYAQSLRNLEDISESIHEKRRLKMLALAAAAAPPSKREPGVGAELLTSPSSIDLEHDLLSLQSLGASSSSTAAADVKDLLCSELSEQITDLNKR